MPAVPALQAEIPQGPAGLAQLGILKHLNKLVCGDRCAVGSGGKSVGYLAHGTATDHMYLKVRDFRGSHRIFLAPGVDERLIGSRNVQENVPLSFTWEIYGDAKAHYLDCFRMFNPLTREHLDVRDLTGRSPAPCA